MSDPVRTPRRGARRVVAVALGGAILASAFALGPAAAFGGDPAPVFTVQPLGATAWNAPTGQPGQPWSIQPQVAIVGDVDPSYDYQATLSITPGSPYGNLSCFGGTTVDMIGGSARWSGCSIDTPGQAYQLSAVVLGGEAIGLPPAARRHELPVQHRGRRPAARLPVDLVHDAAARREHRRRRPVAPAGQAWSVQPVVSVVDQFGNVQTGDNSTIVQLAITPGTPNSGGPGRLSCASGLSVRVSRGSARFSGCSIDTPGQAYQLTAKTYLSGSTLVLYDTSLAFNIAGGASQPARVMFTTQPAGATLGATTPQVTAGTPWSIQPVVTVVNAAGQRVATDYSIVVTLSIDASSQGNGALYCAGGTSVTAAAGFATTTAARSPARPASTCSGRPARPRTAGSWTDSASHLGRPVGPSLAVSANRYSVPTGGSVSFTATLAGTGTAGRPSPSSASSPATAAG